MGGIKALTGDRGLMGYISDPFAPKNIVFDLGPVI
jgi:hypothetical protein